MVGKISKITPEVSTHSRAEAAAQLRQLRQLYHRFQHTAARRRLPIINQLITTCRHSFNTQPRGGGCL